MDWVIFARVSLTLTFLILAAGGPVAIILLRRFMARYMAAHKILESRVEAIERRLQIGEHEDSHD